MAGNALRYFRNKPIRLLCPSQPPFINCVSEPKEAEEGGYLGWMAHTFKQSLQWNISMVETTSSGFGVCHDNGTCDGFIGSLQRNEADIFPVPAAMSMRVNEGTIAYTQAVASISHRIFSEYSLLLTPTSFISQFDVFSPFIWTIILSSILILSLVLSLTYTHPSAQIKGLLWELFRFIPDQGNYSPKTRTQKMLIVVYSFSIFILFNNYFCNLMSTEKFSIDLSILDTYLDDIETHNKYPTFIFGEPGVDVYEMETDKQSIRYKLWKRAEAAGLNSSLYTFSAKHPTGTAHVILGDKSSLISYIPLTTIFSFRRCNLKTKVSQFLSPFDINTFPVYFYMSMKLTPEAKAALHDLSARVAQSGILYKILELVPLVIKDLSDLPETHCLKRSKEEVASDAPQTVVGYVSLNDFYPAFLLLLGAISLAAATLFIEFNATRIASLIKGLRKPPLLPSPLIKSHEPFTCCNTMTTSAEHVESIEMVTNEAQKPFQSLNASSSLGQELIEVGSRISSATSSADKLDEETPNVEIISEKMLSRVQSLVMRTKKKFSGKNLIEVEPLFVRHTQPVRGHDSYKSDESQAVSGPKTFLVRAEIHQKPLSTELLKGRHHLSPSKEQQAFKGTEPESVQQKGLRFNSCLVSQLSDEVEDDTRETHIRHNIVDMILSMNKYDTQKRVDNEPCAGDNITPEAKIEYYNETFDCEPHPFAPC